MEPMPVPVNLVYLAQLIFVAQEPVIEKQNQGYIGQFVPPPPPNLLRKKEKRVMVK